VSGAQWLYLFGGVLTLVGGYFTARLGAKANTAKVVADKEVGAGQLALNIAIRQEAELRELRRWKDQVQLRWWPKHDDWDEKVVVALVRVDPDEAARVDRPPRLPLPLDQDEKDEEAADDRRDGGHRGDRRRADERRER
jgi:hypothetical protein